MDMKKVLMIAAVVAVVGGMVLFFTKDRLGLGGGASMSTEGTDLVIVNDSSDKISAEYKEGEQVRAFVIEPGAQATGGKGFIRVFTAQKAGWYELMYQFPRPAATPVNVTLTQIKNALQTESTQPDTLTKTGMIGDIKVLYEEARM